MFHAPILCSEQAIVTGHDLDKPGLGPSASLVHAVRKRTFPSSRADGADGF